MEHTSTYKYRYRRKPQGTENFALNIARLLQSFFLERYGQAADLSYHIQIMIFFWLQMICNIQENTL